RTMWSFLFHALGQQREHVRELEVAVEPGSAGFGHELVERRADALDLPGVALGPLPRLLDQLREFLPPRDERARWHEARRRGEQDLAQLGELPEELRLLALQLVERQYVAERGHPAPRHRVAEQQALQAEPPRVLRELG